MNSTQEMGFSAEVFERLDQLGLFDELSDEDLIRWAARFRREHYKRGAVVVRQNERPTAFYIVDQGELRARLQAEGGAVVRAHFYPGDFFGETGLLTGEPRNATVDVVADAQLLVLDKLDFDQLVEEYPDIRDQLRVVAREREEVGRKSFPWKHPDEVTIFFSTKHWVALLHAQRVAVLLGFLGLVATSLYLRAEQASFLAGVLMIAAGTLLGFAVFLFVFNLLDWRNDHYIITNRRVLHVERVLLLREDRDEAPIDRVQDVQVVQRGVLTKALNFGDVVIQTAAATQKIIFADVPHPRRVREALFIPLRQRNAQEEDETLEAIRLELEQRLGLPDTSRGEQGAPGRVDGSSVPSDEAAAEGADGAFRLSGLFGGIWGWLNGVFTFETRIVSPDGETVTWRKNRWVLFRSSLLPFFVWLILLFFLFFTVDRGIGYPGLPLLLVGLLFIVVGWWFFFYWDWQNDIYQVSGDRLIDLKRRPLFLEEYRRETTLDRIENIGVTIPNIAAQLFNYGTVIIETAGETGAFEFTYVDNPRSVQAEIFRLREKRQQRRRQEEIQRRRDELANWFEVYEQLKQEYDQVETSEGETRDGVETDSFVG